ncbi:hypothetical protein [Rufibacter immobilis]|uniref:hypothetical protein n=1 Tax=Rufibacter immobilis TaxID=1348778 RepID=UPI0035EB935E
MNEHIKDAISEIDIISLEAASKNNFRLMYASDTDYKVRKSDALYIILKSNLQRIEMNTLVLIGWQEIESYSVEDMSSVNYYLYKPMNKLVLCEMCYKTGYCLAYYSQRKPTEVSDMVKGHKQHYLDVALIRKLRINSVLE